MTGLINLEARVARLESQYEHLTEEVEPGRQEATAANQGVRELRGEMTDFRRAVNGNFNAMRKDLTDLRTEMRNGFADVNKKFEQVDRNFLEMRAKFDGAAAGMSVITEMLTVLMNQRREPRGE